MHRNVSGSLYESVALAGAAVALSCAVGCLPSSHALHRPPSSVPLVVDRATCLDRHIKSIWGGEDIAGPKCIAFIAYHRSAPADDRRIRKVCEHTQIRTRLTGEPQTSFTLGSCAEHLRDELPVTASGRQFAP